MLAPRHNPALGDSALSVTAAQVREHYDSLALIYRTFWGDHIHHGLFARPDDTPEEAQLAMLEYCVAAAGVGAGARVLDVGCGHGGTAVYLASTRGCRVNGITLSEKQSHLAQQHAERSGVAHLCSFEVADADTYLFPTAAYDVVWAMESSEHFRDKPRFIRSAANALATGGVLMSAGLTSVRGPSGVRARRYPTLESSDEYVLHARSARLRITRNEDLSPLVSRTWQVILHRARASSTILPLLPNGGALVGLIDDILRGYDMRLIAYTLLVCSRA